MTSSSITTIRDLLNAAIDGIESDYPKESDTAPGRETEKRPRCTPLDQAELEAFYKKWEELAKALDKCVNEITSGSEESSQDSAKLKQRDDKVREIIILMRVSLADSYLFDDYSLDKKSGGTPLASCACLVNNKSRYFNGHSSDGITWCDTELKELMNAPGRFSFTGSCQYASCWDHAITHLICQTWGYSPLNMEPNGSMLLSDFLRWPKGPRDWSIFLALLIGANKKLPNVTNDLTHASIRAHFKKEFGITAP